ncbi:MAG: outer membrane beta-barrel protein [Caulobacter sp.]|nr:outer membrane beta-barrel protein [Caulobacter sp.]
MTRTMLLASVAAAILAAAGSAQAQQTPTAAPAASDQAAQKGVLVFTPDFFASQRPNTAQDMVNRVPGFVIDDGSGARGFEGAVGNVLINGNRPASKNDTGSNVLGRTPADRVERIELIRGGAAGIDMQGYATVVNVVLKAGANRQSILTWNASVFDGGHDVYGGSYQFTSTKDDRTWSVLLSDGNSTNDSNGKGRAIRRDATGKVVRDEAFSNDGWGGGDSIRVNYSGPVTGGKLEATARYGIHDWQEWQRIESDAVLRHSDYAEDTKSGELGLTWIRPLAPGWTLETRAMHEFERFDDVSTASDSEEGLDQRFTAKGKSSESILRGLVRRERNASLTLEAGGEVAYNMLDTNQAYVENGEKIELPSASVKVEEVRGEAFVKATWRANPKLTLEGGVRLETSTIKQTGGEIDVEKSFFYAKPRFQLTWTPKANHQVRFRFERELGQLDFNDFAASAEFTDGNVFAGNVELAPEQRWISEVTFERRFWGQGVVSLGLRHDEIIGVIDRLPLPGGLAATGNIGDGTLDKITLNIVVPVDRFGIPGGRFTFKNDWNDTHVTDPTTHLKRPISEIRPTQANIGFQQDIVSWKTQWGINWLPLLGRGTYAPDQTGGWRGAGYLEGFVEYKPTPTLAVRVQMNVWDDFVVYRTVYAARPTAQDPARPVKFSEERDINPNTFWTIRVRKTF